MNDKFERGTMARTPIVRDKFDFEIGHLVKSPCHQCAKRNDFPECIDGCKTLDHIQKVLAKGISCTGSESQS